MSDQQARQSPELRPFRTVDWKQTSDKWRKGRTDWRARHGSLLIVLVEQANKVVGRRTLIERVIRTNFGNQLRLYGRGKTSCPGNKDRGIRNWLLAFSLFDGSSRSV